MACLFTTILFFFFTTNASFLLTIHFHTLPAIPHMVVKEKKYRRAHKVWKKTQGMRRDLAHHYGVLNTPSSSCQLNYSTRSFGCNFLGGRKLEGWDEKGNWEVGDMA